ncbi:hypothetical protein FKW77_005398 [Venturia effusa]|uniref:Uncharacterized protein n=1 Tax=Venturia effusa TaxID=50376 RepID=A0A517L3C3_9PEZI|nr:hypothetical protein FKW77_005398 [Venturia effusa]
MLKFVISSRFSTALIVEDDVDWDVDILSQVQQLSDNIRLFFNVGPQNASPYGSGWDVLWIGHCGEVAGYVPHVDYPDSHRIDKTNYTGWAKNFWVDIIPQGDRRVQHAVRPVCTFGYAVTNDSAQEILGFLGQAGGEAFDVGLSRMCTNGYLKCVTVVPQLMVHCEPPADSGYISPVYESDFP